ncbi:hypothetical protein [Microcoleus vaginatus]|uniref:hypothetical protein n=1 Tax=Microcoleus vaginatus TaxID=119532 RepID=UPI004040CA0F
MISAASQGYCLNAIAGETVVLAIRSLAARALWWYKPANAEIREVFTNPEPVKVGSKSEVGKIR